MSGYLKTGVIKSCKKDYCFVDSINEQGKAQTTFLHYERWRGISLPQENDQIFFWEDDFYKYKTGKSSAVQAMPYPIEENIEIYSFTSHRDTEWNNRPENGQYKILYELGYSAVVAENINTHKNIAIICDYCNIHGIESWKKSPISYYNKDYLWIGGRTYHEYFGKKYSFINHLGKEVWTTDFKTSPEELEKALGDQLKIFIDKLTNLYKEYQLALPAETAKNNNLLLKKFGGKLLQINGHIVPYEKIRAAKDFPFEIIHDFDDYGDDMNIFIPKEEIPSINIERELEIFPEAEAYANLRREMSDSHHISILGVDLDLREIYAEVKALHEFPYIPQGSAKLRPYSGVVLEYEPSYDCLYNDPTEEALDKMIQEINELDK